MDPKFIAKHAALLVEVGDYRDHRKLIQRLRDEVGRRPDKVITGAHGVWSVSYSHTAESGHIFSARLLTRSSKERDWLVLGLMATEIGAPAESTPETIRTQPEETHYWIWGTKAVPTAADIDSIRAEVRAKTGN